jgi:hypothetical protein
MDVLQEYPWISLMSETTAQMLVVPDCIIEYPLYLSIAYNGWGVIIAYYPSKQAPSSPQKPATPP